MPLFGDSRVGTTLYTLAYFFGLLTVIMGEDQVLVNEPGPFQPSRNSILKQPYIVTDEMHFDLTVRVHSFGSASYSNILRGTLLDCENGAGCRMPGIWLHNANSQTKGFLIVFSNNENVYQGYWTHNEADAIVAGGTYHLTMDITQNWITVKVNGETVLDESKPSHSTNPDGSYVNSKLYASDPWWNAADVTISNLIITSYVPVPDQVIQCSFANHDGSDVMCGATIKIDDPSHDQGDSITYLTTFQFPGMECVNPRISMDFVSQDFGHDEEYLEVYDGSDTSNPLLGKCGDVDDDDSCGFHNCLSAEALSQYTGMDEVNIMIFVSDEVDGLHRDPAEGALCDGYTLDATLTLRCDGDTSAHDILGDSVKTLTDVSSQINQYLAGVAGNVDTLTGVINDITAYMNGVGIDVNAAAMHSETDQQSTHSADTNDDQTNWLMGVMMASVAAVMIMIAAVWMKKNGAKSAVPPPVTTGHVVPELSLSEIPTGSAGSERDTEAKTTSEVKQVEV